MLIHDSRHGFFETLKNKSVVLLVNTDVDALCSALIISNLLTCDDVPHTLIPVDGWEAVERAFVEFQDQLVSIVMINCGGSRCLLDMNIAPHVNVFIIDSHRPFNHENVFDNNQIHILLDQSEVDELRIPSPNEVMAEDSSDDDSGADSDEEEPSTFDSRLEKIRLKAIKKEEKRLWERKRQDVLWKYYESSFYSLPSSVRMLELAAKLNRASAHLMWYAAVGLNSQFVDRLISIEAYTAVCIDRMRPFIHKYSPKNLQTCKTDDTLRISFDKELPLALYSHWDLYHSMMVDEYFSIKTKNWSQKGDANIKHLLANLGITLAETTQKFEALSTEQRKKVVEILDTEMDSSFATFFVHLGYSTRLNAADVARVVALRLEMPRSKESIDRFTSAAKLLSASVVASEPARADLNVVFDRLYQRMMKVIWKTVSAAINQSEILPNGPFYLYTCSRVIEEAESRHFLYNTTNFLLKAFTSSKKGRSTKPLIATFPLPPTAEDENAKSGFMLVTGVMPMATVYEDNSLKTCMGRAFERVKKMAPKLNLKIDSFDSNIVTIKNEDRTRFFDCLQSILETA